jgi:hypothetical protein
MRQELSVRAGARSEAEDADRGSCCAPVGLRWRAEQELRGREPFDDVHGSAAGRTVPERARLVRGRRCRRSGHVFRATKQLEAERQEGGALPVGEEAEVADAHEAAWQQVEQEAAQELFDRQSHDPLLVAVGGVAPAEGHVALGKSNQPAVGNGDAMGVGAEIAQHMFRPAERPFGVDDPVVTEQYPQPGGEGARFRKRQEMSVELECACLEGAPESSDELAAEDTAEHLDGQEEGVSGGNPA